jgi:CheY-like chemotaxis protein
MERKDYAFDRIETASRHLLAVINDVLDMSRIEAGKLELVNEPFGLENTFQRVFNVVSFRLEEKRQRYTTGLDPHIPRLLLGDEQRLVQVLTNLLSNAVKFTPEGKDIRMEAHLVGREDDVVSVRFEVCDEGIGISREQQERLFQSFEQAETSTTRRYGGSGLGLAISKHIVEMMGGCIWVESDLGKGARFCFTVGLAEGKDTEAVAVEIERMKGEGKDAVPDYRGKRLLLAEDVEINQEIVTAMLEPTGITIHCAATGDEALRMFEASVSAESFAYDLIFMDVHMPVMDGYEVTRLIRGLPYPEASTVPIIAMTANVFQDDIDKCLKSGMNAHLGKPLAYREMMAAVRRYLGAGA